MYFVLIMIFHDFPRSSLFAVISCTDNCLYSFTVFLKHSKSADLLRKSLLSHVWRVPSSKALSCKHERLFDLLTLVSYYKICQTNIHTNASNFIIKQSLRDNHIFDCLSSSVYLLVLQIIHYYSAFDFANIAISPTPFKTIVGRYA